MVRLFAHVYFMFTEGFGRFRIVAEASGVKSESTAKILEAAVSDSAFGGIVFRYHVLGTGTDPCVPVPGAWYRN